MNLKPILPLCVLLLVPTSLRGQDEPAGDWGHLKGRITVLGTVPAPQELDLNSDQAFCGQGEPHLDQSLLVNQQGGLKNAFVMMYFGRRDKNRPAIHPNYDATKRPTVQLSNVECRFEPYATFVQTGQVLTLENADNIGHNCHITTMRNEDNVNLSANDSVEVTFANPDKVPGTVSCDIHRWMEGVILVRDEPYVAITNEDGHFLIENLPAGKWTFQFWHKRIGYMNSLQRDGESFLGRRAELEIEIKPNETFDLGELTLNASDFKPANK